MNVVLFSRDIFYSEIVHVLKQCSNGFPGHMSTHSNHSVPGWNDEVKPYHNAARESYLLWRNVGKPRSGVSYDTMRHARIRFKHALKTCRKNANSILADKLAIQHCNKNDKQFWKDIKNSLNSKVKLPNVVNSCKGSDIPEMWKQHYNDMLIVLITVTV